MHSIFSFQYLIPFLLIFSYFELIRYAFSPLLFTIGQKESLSGCKIIAFFGRNKTIHKFFEVFKNKGTGVTKSGKNLHNTKDVYIFAADSAE